MNKLFVKICGITRPQDADLAGSLGASALGFVFWPGSPRAVSPGAAAGIARGIEPGVMKVGVFVDQPAEEVTRIMDEVGLDVAQLHGHESPEYCRKLMAGLKVRRNPDRAGARAIETATTDASTPAVFAFRPTIFKSIGIGGNGSINIDSYDRDVVPLVDAFDPVRFGGTGKTVNWDAAREIAAARQTILAGGLNAANIKLAVRSVRPYGVDVSSGVESAPGVKDPNRLRSFFEALHD